MSQTNQDPEENLPEWLRALRRRQEEDAAEKPAADLSGRQDPDWLQEIRQRYRPDEPPPVTSQPEPEPGSALEDTQPRPPLRSEPQEPEAEELGVSLEGPALPEADEVLVPSLSEESFPQTFADDEGEVPLPVVPAFSEDPDVVLSGSELPGWLEALRPGENYPVDDERSDAMLPASDPSQEGPLAGLADVLPGGGQISQLGKPPEFSARLEATGSQRQHAAALQQLLQAEHQPVVEEQPAALPTRLLSLLSGALLIMAVLFPLLSRSQNSNRPDIAFFPEVRSLFNSIDVLPPGAPVLVAFELQPAQYGEVSPVAAAPLGHLLDKQARLVFISTEETGPALAERLLAEQFASAPAVSTGSYTNLGYLSGGTAALRSFISDPRSTLLAGSGRSEAWQAPALESVEHLRDFALILVVGRNAETVRAWVEQSAGELPGGLHAATSAQAQPLLRPYLQSSPSTLRSLVSGIQGAVVYERLQARDGLGRQYWDAYTYGLGAVVLLILLGGLYSRLIQTKPEREAAPAGGSGGS